MLKEFKEFAIRGNVLDLAVGVIIGAAFGKIVSSFVSDVVMPPLGLLLGQVDFKQLMITLKAAEVDGAGKVVKEAVAIRYGQFVSAIFDFMLVAFAVFIVVKGINKMKKQAPPPSPDTRECPRCLSSIPKKASRCAHCTSDVVPVG